MRHGWSLEYEWWAQLEKALPASAWQKVRFRLLDEDSVPSSPGIYAMSAGTPLHVDGDGMSLFRQLHNVLYLGKSTNLRARFKQHVVTPKAELKQAMVCYGAPSFWFITVETARLDELEGLLIECLGPSANKKRNLQYIGATIGKPVPA